jgi:hypothetical protein
MDKVFAIRAVIFIVPGLLMIFIPQKVYQFQIYLLGKLRIKSNPKQDLKPYPYIGIFFVIIAIGLFIYAITH